MANDSPIDLNSSLDSDISEEMLCSNPYASNSSSDNDFDEIVGALENILMDEEFLNLQNDFCSTNCSYFTNDDENKFIYTELFSQYTETIEGYIVTKLTVEIEGFSMEKLGDLLSTRTDEITGDVFDMLTSFTDFDEFKSLMLAHKGVGGVGGVEFDGMLGIVSKDNKGVVGSGVINGGEKDKKIKVEAVSPTPNRRAESKIQKPKIHSGVLSPNSREAKDAASP